MEFRSRSATGSGIWIVVIAALVSSLSVMSHGGELSNREEKEPCMRKNVNGTFEINVVPQTGDEKMGIGEWSITKNFSGDFEGTSAGTMLTSYGDPKTSAAYVAIEQLQGKIGGRSGSFVLVHRGVMSKDSQEMQVTIAPDSGTDELLGIEGTFHIEITNGVHFYTMEYSLPE